MSSCCAPHLPMAVALNSNGVRFGGGLMGTSIPPHWDANASLCRSPCASAADHQSMVRRRAAGRDYRLWRLRPARHTPAGLR